jgi:hypothetical protein
MLSRWTDFLTTDGEKDWRKRDEEFVETVMSRESLMAVWEEGWKCLFDALSVLRTYDLSRKVTIRQESMSVMDAIFRQLTHYAYHIGQIVFIGRALAGEKWNTLSIPKKK